MSAAHLNDKVYNFTNDNQLFSAPTTVVVGLSGGADSMALFHCLCHWRDPGLTVVAAHLHHGIRGEQADRDEEFVRQQCERAGIRLVVEHTDVPRLAQEQHIGLEEAGRNARYALFERVRVAVGACAVATAHTASDQAETVLLHIARGCGAAGVAGIPPRRSTIVRPLLGCTREEIERYCEENAIAYVRDETNDDVTYSRNRIRREVLPSLEKINPAVVTALGRLAIETAQDDAYLNALAKERLDAAKTEPNGYRRSALLEAPAPVRMRMVRLALENLDCRSAERVHYLALTEAMERGRGIVDLPGGFCVRVMADMVRFCTAKPETGDDTIISVAALPASVVVGGRCATLRVYDFESADSLRNVHKMFLHYALDYDRIQDGLAIRTRQPGDYFHPAGRGVGKTLKRWMIEWHLPADRRDTVPLLCDGAGVVLVPGIACDERVRVTDETHHLLVWQWQDEPS